MRPTYEEVTEAAQFLAKAGLDRPYWDVPVYRGSISFDAIECAQLTTSAAGVVVHFERVKVMVNGDLIRCWRHGDRAFREDGSQIQGVISAGIISQLSRGPK